MPRICQPFHLWCHVVPPSGSAVLQWVSAFVSNKVLIGFRFLANQWEVRTFLNWWIWMTQNHRMRLQYRCILDVHVCIFRIQANQTVVKAAGWCRYSIKNVSSKCWKYPIRPLLSGDQLQHSNWKVDSWLQRPVQALVELSDLRFKMRSCSICSKSQEQFGLRHKQRA